MGTSSLNEGASIEDICLHDISLMVKLEFLFFSFQNCPFWAYIKKPNTFTFWCMVIPSWSTFWYTPNKGPKDFVNWFFCKSNYKSQTMTKRPSSMVRLHDPCCKPALRPTSHSQTTFLAYSANTAKFRCSLWPCYLHYNPPTLTDVCHQQTVHTKKPLGHGCSGNGLLSAGSTPAAKSQRLSPTKNKNVVAQIHNFICTNSQIEFDYNPHGCQS